MPIPSPRQRRTALLACCALAWTSAHAQTPPGIARVPLDPALFSNSNQKGVIALDVPGVTREAGREVIAQDGGFILVAGDAHTDPDSAAPSRILLARIRPQSTPIAVPGGAAAFLDPGFGDGGLRVEAYARSAHSHALLGMVQQPDGRIVLMVRSALLADGPNAPGELLFARYLANGTPDTGFGTAGVVSVPLCDGADCALRRPLSFDLAMEPDGSLLAIASLMKLLPDGGFREIELELRRLQADGTPDAAFGSGGVQAHDEFPGLGEEIGAGQVRLARRADGRIAVVVNTLDFELDGHGTPAVMLLRADGTPDTTFGTGGSRLLPVDPARIAMLPMAIDMQDDGRIAVGGMAQAPFSSAPSFFAARLTATGAVDTAFGGNGLVFGDSTPVGDSSDIANAMAHDARGRLYLVGDTGPNAFDAHVGVLRLQANGAADEGFAANGFTRYTELAVQTGITNVFLTNERAFAATVAPTGVLVATGSRVSQDGTDRSEDRLIAFRLQRTELFADEFE